MASTAAPASVSADSRPYTTASSTISVTTSRSALDAGCAVLWARIARKNAVG
jgi:hypothetical protein